MGKRYLTESPNNNGLTITEVFGDDVNGNKLTKILFEISRTTDLTTHFDSAVHTRKAIASGLSGHRALALIGECDDSDIPIDRYFREAWEWVAGQHPVEVNMSKARNIHMDVIRKVRDAELIKTDVPYLRALEAGNISAQATISAEKQVLRDIPQTFELTALTPQQLKSQWPLELPV